MKKAFTLVLGVVSFSWFVMDTAGRGWSRPSSDFPNYYTAALLVRAHEPLRKYYDWTWFQRQMHYAGIDSQLGGYIPQTPLTMMPFIPLSFLSPLMARKAWFILNFIFLGVSLWLISRMTKFTIVELWLLAFLGSITLRSNLDLGQYYFFLLALMTAATYCILRKRDLAGGGLLGAAIALKLYGAPLVLVAVCGRRWRLLCGVSATLALCAACAITVFGWHDVSFFLEHVMPRALKGETLNPYHPSNGSAATLLRRLFIAEAELNPRPWKDNPAAAPFFWLLFSSVIIAFQAVATGLHAEMLSGRTLAWWLLGMLLVSPNTASYTFVLLILPVALLLNELAPRLRILVLAGYFLLTLPLWPAWSWAFPKLWLLLGLFLLAGAPLLRAIPLRFAVASFGGCVLLSGAVAMLTMRTSEDEPQKHFARAVTEPGSIYSASPAASRAGLLYESIGQDNYVIRRAGRTYSFHGDAFHPSTPDAGGSIYLELVSGRGSAIVRFDEFTAKATSLPLNVPKPREPVISHNGRSLAFVSGDMLFIFDGHAIRQLAGAAHDPSFVPDDNELVYVNRGKTSSVLSIDLKSGRTATMMQDRSDLATPSLSPDGRYLVFAARREANWQVWIKEIQSGRETKITGGSCNNFSPVWDGSAEIVFASDCRRGLGLPALFRAVLK
jgi:hypothetical protein